jgi:hypothetical protein
VDKNIGVAEEVLEPQPIVVIPEIQSGAALAESDIRHHPWFIPMWRVDSQHIGAKASEEAGRNWPCQHAREVEYPDAAKRTHRIRAPRSPCDCA